MASSSALPVMGFQFEITQTGRKLLRISKTAVERENGSSNKGRRDRERRNGSLSLSSALAEAEGTPTAAELDRWKIQQTGKKTVKILRRSLERRDPRQQRERDLRGRRHLLNKRKERESLDWEEERERSEEEEDEEEEDDEHHFLRLAGRSFSGSLNSLALAASIAASKEQEELSSLSSGGGRERERETSEEREHAAAPPSIEAPLPSSFRSSSLARPLNAPSSPSSTAPLLSPPPTLTPASSLPPSHGSPRENNEIRREPSLSRGGGGLDWFSVMLDLRTLGSFSRVMTCNLEKRNSLSQPSLYSLSGAEQLPVQPSLSPLQASLSSSAGSLEREGRKASLLPLTSRLSLPLSSSQRILFRDSSLSQFSCSLQSLESLPPLCSEDVLSKILLGLKDMLDGRSWASLLSSCRPFALFSTALREVQGEGERGRGRAGNRVFSFSYLGPSRREKRAREKGETDSAPSLKRQKRVVTLRGRRRPVAEVAPQVLPYLDGRSAASLLSTCKRLQNLKDLLLQGEST